MFNLLALFVALTICQSEPIYPELVYRTKSQPSLRNNFGSYCHYFSVITFDRIHTYVPYCFRTMNISMAYPVQGESFRSLYEQNRTSSDLLFPRASLDIIEDYEIYAFHRRLNRSHSISGEQLYQRCEPPSFGDVCQYRFSTNDEFTKIVNESFLQKKFHQPTDVLMITNGTCFQELQCQGAVVCLDWREVCDGYVHCPDGQDEEHCHELEMNECDSLIEYRCKNGHCIPQEFFFDRTPDCLDKSDENNRDIEFCHTNMLWYCEDTICDSYDNHRIYGAPMAFTCGDGQCREMSNVNIILPTTSASVTVCGTGRDLLHTQRLFSSNEECLEHIKCTWNFHLFQTECKIKCISQYQCSIRISIVCAHRPYIIFPSKPIFDNHVFFISELNRTTSWFSNYIPSLICFDPKRCSQYQTTINLDGRACTTVDQFKDLRDLGNSTNWRNIYVALYAIFARCASSGLLSYNDSSCGHSSLFHCPTSSKCISRHRVQDGSIDCFTGEDETFNDICDELQHRFRCDIDQRCLPRRFLMDFEKQCTDGSDEALGFHCIKSHSENCDILAGRHDTSKEIAFSTVCNGIQEIRPNFEGDDTDETNCVEYSCITRYTLCNDVWNCVDGRDELFCDNTMSSIYCNVERGEFFCLQSINQTIEYCASVEKINNTQIDCLGSSDERDFCRKHYPFDFARRYQCWNASICINPFQICDCHPDCPFEDDENPPLCPWNRTLCSKRHFPCSGIVPEKGKMVFVNSRCDGTVNCINIEDEWLCDLMDMSETRTFTSNNLLDFVPILPRNVQSRSIRSAMFSWYCNRGILVESTTEDEELKCLCPPAYYGDRCEYQRKRLSVILELRVPTMIERTSAFKLLVFLVQTSTGNVTYSTEIIYLPSVQCLPKYIVDLLYPLCWQMSDQHYVRISIYHLTQKSRQIEYRGSWFFSIKFEFLPVNRLVTQLALIEKSNAKIHKQCADLPCVHGTCESYLNQPQHHFCYCESTWFGRLCDRQSAEECNCSPESICIAPDICLCPLDKIGSRCYVPFDPCQNHPCGARGICMASDVRANQWTCVCDERFLGEQCQYNASSVDVRFTINIQIPSAILVHFISLSNIARKQVRSYFRRIGFQQDEAIAFYPDEFIPNIVLVQLFDNKNTNPLHLVFLNNDETQLFYDRINVQVTENNECLAISKIFGSEFSQLPFLHRVKFYQRPCQNTTARVQCFYDEIHICLCNKFNQVDCFPFVIANTTARCPVYANPCQNGGTCLQDEKQCPKTSICVCPECTFGLFCQFSTSPYSLSLDAIIGPFIKPNVKFYQQSSSVLVSLAMVSAIFMLGIIDVGFCLITFSRPMIRSTGRGIYLLCLSVVCLVNVSACFTQYLRLLFEQTNHIASYRGCLINQFVLKVSPIVNNWLQACASMENVSIAYFGLRYRKMLSYHVAKYVTGLILILSLMMCIHDPFHRHLLYDEFEQRTWCVVSFPSRWLKVYDSTLTIIHYLAPFSINLLSSVVIIILTARLRARTTNRYQQTFWEKLQQEKHLIISPILLTLVAVPRQIIALLTTCMKLTGRSQPYLMLMGYYIPYLPSVLTTVVFILPSTIYKEELWQALNQFIRIYYNKHSH